MRIPLFLPFDDSPGLSSAAVASVSTSLCSCISDLLGFFGGFGFSGDFPDTSLLMRMSMSGFDSAGLKMLHPRVVRSKSAQTVNVERTNPPLSLLFAMILSSRFCLLSSISSCVICAVVASAMLSGSLSQPELVAECLTSQNKRHRDASKAIFPRGTRDREILYSPIL